MLGPTWTLWTGAAKALDPDAGAADEPVPLPCTEGVEGAKGVEGTEGAEGEGAEEAEGAGAEAETTEGLRVGLPLLTGVGGTVWSGSDSWG